MFSRYERVRRRGGGMGPEEGRKGGGDVGSGRRGGRSSENICFGIDGEDVTTTMKGRRVVFDGVAKGLRRVSSWW